MRCPNCDAEMHQDDEEEGLWHCGECNWVEDRS